LTAANYDLNVVSSGEGTSMSDKSVFGSKKEIKSEVEKETKEFSTKASLFTIENLIKKSPSKQTEEESKQILRWNIDSPVSNASLQQHSVKQCWWPVVCSSS